VVVVVVFTVVW